MAVGGLQRSTCVCVWVAGVSDGRAALKLLALTGLQLVFSGAAC